MASMATKRDHYEILGVDRSASDRDIASAYRALAIKYHPDSNPDDEEATERFKEAAEAYEVISDPEKRARYDHYGHAGVDSGSGRFTDVEDIFDAFGDIFGGGGGIFGDIFGGGRRRGGRRARRGADVRCEVILDLHEAATGVAREVQFDRSVPCEACSGSGSRTGSTPAQCQRCGGHGQVVQSAGILRVQTTCPTCQGRGSVITDACDGCHGVGYTATRIRMDVNIPAGVDDGMRLRLTGEGEPSRDGGPSGDCYCFISVKEHSLFRRDGNQLFVQLPITFSQAALGAALEIPTLDGPDQLKIPAGTQSGDVFRLRGRGISDTTNRGKGDLVVQTLVDVPKNLTSRQEDLLRELAEIEQKHVTPHRSSFLNKLRDCFAASDKAKANTGD